MNFVVLKPCLNEYFKNTIGFEKQNHMCESKKGVILETFRAIFKLYMFSTSPLLSPLHVKAYKLPQKLVHLIWLNLIFTILWKWYFNSTCKKTEALRDK